MRFHKIPGPPTQSGQMAYFYLETWVVSRGLNGGEVQQPHLNLILRKLKSKTFLGHVLLIVFF